MFSTKNLLILLLLQEYSNCDTIYRISISAKLPFPYNNCKYQKCVTFTTNNYENQKLKLPSHLLTLKSLSYPLTY